jgi:hypothetical protein
MVLPREYPENPGVYGVYIYLSVSHRDIHRQNGSGRSDRNDGHTDILVRVLLFIILVYQDKSRKKHHGAGRVGKAYDYDRESF